MQIKASNLYNNKHNKMQKNVAQAHKMLNMLHDNEISESLATSMLKLYGKFNKISQAEKLFNKSIKNERIRKNDNFYSTMISIYYKNDR